MRKKRTKNTALPFLIINCKTTHYYKQTYKTPTFMTNCDFFLYSFSVLLFKSKKQDAFLFFLDFLRKSIGSFGIFDFGF